LNAQPKTAEIGNERLARHDSRRQRRHRAITALHKYFEPIGISRGGAACQESRGAWAQIEALGEDQPRAGLESRDGLFGRRRVLIPALEALKLPFGRLRLHHVHRQQRNLCATK